MSEDAGSSLELSRIAKLNRDFRRNYGSLFGTFLYQRAADGRGALPSENPMLIVSNS